MQMINNLRDIAKKHKHENLESLNQKRPACESFKRALFCAFSIWCL